MLVRIALLSSLLVLVAAGSGDASPPARYPVLVSAHTLGVISKQLSNPIYWLGPEPGTHLELTRTAGARSYVRYLPRSVSVGSSREFLTIGSYRFVEAYAQSKKFARVKLATVISGPPDEFIFYIPKVPTSVYVAFRGTNSQIEIYSPVPGEAQKEALSGHLRKAG